MSFKVGDYVRFADPHGSTGKIVGTHDTLRDFYYVEWHYGLDAKGEPIQSRSGGLRAEELEPITERQYRQVAKNRAFPHRCKEHEDRAAREGRPPPVPGADAGENCDVCGTAMLIGYGFYPWCEKCAEEENKTYERDAQKDPSEPLPRYVVETAAIAAHEANRAWCVTHDDDSQTAWNEAPHWQRESAIKGVEGVLRGNGPRESHESWLAEKEATGWVYGPIKDAQKKTHPCMVPYDDLPPEQRAKDAIFVGVVRVVLDAFKVTLSEEAAARNLTVTAHGYGHHAEAVALARRLAEEADRG